MSKIIKFDYIVAMTKENLDSSTFETRSTRERKELIKWATSRLIQYRKLTKQKINLEVNGKYYKTYNKELTIKLKIRRLPKKIKLYEL